jgi:hypothetical protein
VFAVAVEIPFLCGVSVVIKAPLRRRQRWKCVSFAVIKGGWKQTLSEAASRSNRGTGPVVADFLIRLTEFQAPAIALVSACAVFTAAASATRTFSHWGRTISKSREVEIAIRSLHSDGLKEAQSPDAGKVCCENEAPMTTPL